MKMVREVFFWPLFLPIKKSEVRKSKVSHDINVYLLRGLKVITPFPLGGFYMIGTDISFTVLFFAFAEKMADTDSRICLFTIGKATL